VSIRPKALLGSIATGWRSRFQPSPSVKPVVNWYSTLA
jgi:hypothetical protein